jgi:hypothetical protein
MLAPIPSGFALIRECAGAGRGNGRARVLPAHAPVRRRTAAWALLLLRRVFIVIMLRWRALLWAAAGETRVPFFPPLSFPLLSELRAKKNAAFSLEMTLTTAPKDSQIITLGHRLILGIMFEGCLACVPTTRDAHLRYTRRPYLAYFASVCRHFKADVTIFTEINRHVAKRVVFNPNFEKHFFPCTHRVVYDTSSMSLKSVKPFNYQDFLEKRAKEAGTHVGRCLFVEAQCSHRFFLSQSLVLQRYEGRMRLRNSDVKNPSSAAEKSVAVAENDCTLIALAEMIKELACSNEHVCHFLAREPLVESVRVPFHGHSFVLPKDKCDLVEEFDIDKLEVSEPAVYNEECTIVETEEHKAMFK